MADSQPTSTTLRWPDDAIGQTQIAEVAAGVLRAGGLVVYPTDTVYGLGADATQSAAIEGIYRAKGRPDEKAIVWLIASVDEVETCCHADDRVNRLAEHFWPGALTLILNRRHFALGQLATLGVRIPRHETALAIIRAFGGPVATTSANRSGEPSARTAAEARGQIGNDVDLIIDAGSSPIGQESTVLDLTSTPPRILRAGALGADEIAAVLGDSVVGGPQA